MTLDEAIQHCEEVAETNERICDTEPSIGLPDIYRHKDEAKKCANEHRQLAEWLKELKAYKEQSGDAISRQAAKRALEDRFMELQKRHNDKRYETNYCLNTILELPSVSPQQRTGRWIERSDIIGKWYECDQCHTDWGGPVNFCPNCGAKMEVEE